MSKVKIQGHASGTGVLTVTAPNTSTDRTITLPDSTGSLIADDGSGNVGIGMTPTQKLEVNGGIALPTTQLLRWNNSGTIAGSIGVDNSNNMILYNTEYNTERMRILAGGGLTFNGDTAAANALDDYEEGTFTATLTSVPTAPTNPPTATGSYTKVGNRVHFEIFRWSNVDTSGGSGEMRITGLPFTASTATITQNVATFGMNFDTSKYQWCEISTTIIYFVESVNGSAWSNWNITAGTGKYLAISGSYQTS